MPRLEQYIGERELLAPGTYGFTVSEVGIADNKNGKENETVTIKGTVDGKKYTIFRYLHPNMLWLVATELVALGAAKDREVDLHNASQVANIYSEFNGQTLKVKVSKREYNSNESNEFRIQGLADGAAFGAV